MLAKEELKQTILSGIYNTIIVNDIGYKNGLREPELVALVAKYLADSIGQLINPNKIVNTLKSANFDISYNAVQRYLKYFEEAYLFYKSSRYDIRGRKILSTQGKYYIVDTGLRTQALGERNNDRGSVLENIVYVELLRRGYTVQIGKLDNKEIDNFQLCAQLRVCSQAGGIPVYPRFSQPDNSESWDDAGNGI
mgnify:CR=1 FL=1